MSACRRPLMFTLGALLTTVAFAAGPWVSVPSTPTADQRLVVNAGNLGPSAPVTVRIEHPGGTYTLHPVVADAGGKLKFEYVLAATGGYGVEVFDTEGKLIGGGRLGFFR